MNRVLSILLYHLPVIESLFFYLCQFVFDVWHTAVSFCFCMTSMHRRNKMCIGIHWKHTFRGASADNLGTWGPLVVSVPFWIKLTPGKHMLNPAFHFRKLPTYDFLLSLTYDVRSVLWFAFVSFAIIIFPRENKTLHPYYSLFVIKKM